MFPSSRTLQLLASGFSFDSGRSDIRQIFINGIEESPFAFRGLFSDRFFYALQTKTPLDMTSYPHNFFVEVLYQFGVVFGVIFFLLLLLLAIRSFILLNDKKAKSLNLSFFFFFFFASGVARLFASGSYLTTYEFFLFVGIVLRIIILSKRKLVKKQVRV